MDSGQCRLQIKWGNKKKQRARGWLILNYVGFFNADSSGCKHLLFKIHGGLIVEEMPL